MHGSCEDGIRRSNQDRSHQRRKERARQPLHTRVNGPQQRTRNWEPARRSSDFFGRAIDLRHWKAREKTKRNQELQDQKPSPAASETPAEANVAMPVKAATAARTMGIASAAPVPSPRRISRSSSGRWPMMASKGP